MTRILPIVLLSLPFRREQLREGRNATFSLKMKFKAVVRTSKRTRGLCEFQ